MSDEECQYENKTTVKREWERIASPEIDYLEKHWTMSSVDTEISVLSLIKDCKEKTNQVVSIEQMVKSLKTLGYVIKNNIIKNIEPRPASQKGLSF